MNVADQAARLEWGKSEHYARLADIAKVKTGEISLADAQKRARSRARKSGMTPTAAHRALCDGQRAIKNGD